MSCPAWWTRGESNSRPKKCAATGTQALGCYEYELRCEERCDTVGDTSKHVCFYWLLRGLRCLSARHRLYVNLTTFSSKPLRARMVPSLGIEPSPPVLQTGAMTTLAHSANWSPIPGSNRAFPAYEAGVSPSTLLRHGSRPRNRTLIVR